MYFIEYFIQAPWLMWAAFALELVIIFTARLWSTKTPINRLLFAFFAFLTGVTVAPLVGVVAATPGGLPILIKAFLAAAFTFGATALVGWTTKKDLSGLGGFLFVALIAIIITSVVGIFLPWGSTFEMVFSGIGIVIFSAYTMYDFQKLKHYPEDRYIDAALNLYLDFFNLFIFILRFMLASRD